MRGGTTRNRRGGRRSAWLCGAAIGGLIASFPAWGPPLATAVLRSALRRQLPAATVTARVRVLTFTHAEIDRVSLGGKPESPACARLTLRYTPAGLWRRDVAALTVDGVRLCLEKGSNRVALAGVPAGAVGPATAAPTRRPWRVARVGATDVRLDGITLPARQRRHLLAGDVTLRRQQERYVFEGLLAHADHPFAIDGFFEPAGASGEVRVANLAFASAPRAAAGGWRCGARELRLRGTLGRTPEGVFSLDGGWGELAGVAWVSNLSFRVPFAAGTPGGGAGVWPLVPRDSSQLGWSRAAAGGVAWQAGALQSAITEEGRCLAWRLPLQAEESAAALDLKWNVRDGGHGGDVTLALPATTLAPTDALWRAFAPRLACSGLLAATACVSWAAAQAPTWRVDAALAEGEARDSAGRWRISGVATRVAAKGGLSRPRSPVVTTTFHDADFAGLKLDGGSVRWQWLEGAWLVERADLAWCGGWVRLAGLRIDPRELDLDGVLSFERIDAARLLALLPQLDGVATGRLDGRLPLRLRRNHLSLTEGQLYSLPGEGGTLRLHDTTFVNDYLQRAGMPAAVRRKITAALRDLAYDLLRLDLVSLTAREARLKLRVAGRAAHDKDLPPVDLEINLNGPLEGLLNLGLQLNIPGRGSVQTNSPPRPSQADAGVPERKP